MTLFMITVLTFCIDRIYIIYIQQKAIAPNYQSSAIAPAIPQQRINDFR